MEKCATSLILLRAAVKATTVDLSTNKLLLAYRKTQTQSSQVDMLSS